MELNSEIRTDQELFWATDYSKEYIRKNDEFDSKILIDGWNNILRNIAGPRSILECGANIGRNIYALNEIFPKSSMTAIEISPDAASILRERYDNLTVINSSIKESNLPPNSFDLVYTMGVLIHINPAELLENISKILSYTSRYLVVGEYFNRTPISIDYQNQKDRLFKRDFGRFIIDNFGKDLKIVDYGFLWGYLYESGGFDDITWWVFEKK